MSRKKRTIVDEVLPDETNQTATTSDIEDLVIVLSKVYKTNGAKRSFCFQSAEPVDEVLIQERQPMGGSFAVFEYNAQGDVVNSTTFDIEPKPATTPNASTSPTDIHTTMLMNELQFMRGMVMNMVNNRSSEATPIAEIIRAAKDMTSMGGGKDPVEMLIRGMELGKQNGGSASSDWKAELIHTAKEALVPVVNILSQNSNKPNGVTTMIPANTQTPATIVKDAIIWLKGKIMVGLTPSLAVDWILQNGNDPQYQPILAMAVQGTIDNFIELDNDIANEPYRSWFTSAIQMIKDEYAEQSGNTSDMDGGNRNVSNDAPNEKPSATKSKLKKAV